MTSSEIQKFASIYGLPNPCCLIHRLAVIVANLFVYKHYEFKDCLLLINSMFNELYIELKLRYDRLICLPSQILYEEVYNTFNANDSQRLTEEIIMINENRPRLNAWNYNAIRSVNTLKFNDWLVDCYYNLDFILHRFNACILKAREYHQYPKPKVQDDVDDEKDEDDDAFFDAHDETSTVSYHDDDVESIRQNASWLDSCSRNDALSEAESILNWFKSRSLTDHLQSLLPHVILECMLTFHSFVPHPRLTQWYSSLLKVLDQQIYDLLKIHSSKSVNGSSISTVKKSSFPLSTYCDILEIIAQFSIQFTCLNELISNVLLVCYMLESDRFLNFLCKLSNHIILLENITGQSNPWIPSLGGWINLPNITSTIGMIKENERDMILKFLKMLFDKCIPSELSSIGEGRFNFTSVAQTWIPPNRPVDLRRPNFEIYIFYAELPCPNQLTSRLGPHRLYIELEYDTKTSTYKNLIMAGSFSHDTQFF
ncbi:Rab3 GTPase-activating catalytic subunit [Schistosoma japonicum]|uniref:Rab3 GTPase-activating catalytic subunit n=1 Tax=Schistosoma japonicum TaxID=6182 RepID=A0A4Z2DCD2_SCHJA|nr:Rab3 GTPase-activating catalytic subunit [Schistosoma japonicum]